MPYALPHPSHPKVSSKKRLYKVPCKVLVNDSRLCATIRKAEFTVIAESAVAAANYIRDRLDFLPETEIYTWGPKGGETYRYVGWESAIGHELIFHPTYEEKAEAIEEIFGVKLPPEQTNAIV